MIISNLETLTTCYYYETLKQILLIKSSIFSNNMNICKVRKQLQIAVHDSYLLRTRYGISMLLVFKIMLY